ncbi:MAG: hypothetical protein WEB00_14020 [Dehalococcoidia bacterium]
MHLARPFLLTLPVIAVILSGCGAFGADEDGNRPAASDEEDDSSDEERGLEAILRPFFGVAQDQDLRVVIGRLPSAFPEDFPLPAGVDPITGISLQAVGNPIIVTFSTADGPDELVSFYEEELGPEVSSLQRGQDNIVEFQREDGSSGQVVIDQFDDATDESTLIISIFAPESAEPVEEDPEPLDIGEGVDLPEGYPEDRVPLYPGSTVIQSGFAGEAATGLPGFRQYSVVMVTDEQDFEAIIEFYEGELEDAGYTVSVDDQGDAVQITLEDEETPEASGALQITVFADDRELTQIQIQVNAEFAE